MVALLMGLVIGAFVGSFLGVVVHRLPQGKSIVSPPSHCDDCGTVLRWYDNVPLLGWLLLRGRCRWCGSPIPVSVWLIEILTAVLTGLVCWWAFGTPEAVITPVGWWLAEITGWPALATALAAMVILVVLWALIVSTLTDLAHMIIPDELSKPLQLCAPFLALLVLASMGDSAANAYLVSLYSTRVIDPSDGTRIGMWAIGAGTMVTSGIVALAIIALIASLPLARWIYGTRLSTPFPWREEDHAAFAKGVYWFSASLIPPLIALWIAAAVFNPHHEESGFLVLFIVLALTNALFGALCGWFLPYAVGLVGSFVARRNAMGYGDVKMLAWLGAFLGPVGVVYTFFLAALYGSIVGIPMRLSGGRREIPFGPYLVLGAITSFAIGHHISSWISESLLW